MSQRMNMKNRNGRDRRLYIDIDDRIFKHYLITLIPAIMMFTSIVAIFISHRKTFLPDTNQDTLLNDFDAFDAFYAT